MSHTEHEFETEIMLLGDKIPATCRYASTVDGNIVPYLVRVDGQDMVVDNWKQQLTEQAEADWRKRQSRKVKADQARRDLEAV